MQRLCSHNSYTHKPSSPSPLHLVLLLPPTTSILNHHLPTLSHLYPPSPPPNHQRRHPSTHQRQNRQRPPHSPPPRALRHEPAPNRPDEHTARESGVEEPVRRGIRAPSAKHTGVGFLFDIDDVGDLREQRRHGHAQRRAQTSQHCTKERYLIDSAVVDGPHGDEERDRQGKPDGGGDAGTAFVAPVSDYRRDEGWQDQRQEDETAACGAPSEKAVDVEGEDGVPGCEEGGLDEGTKESGKETAGGEKGEDWGQLAFGWGDWQGGCRRFWRWCCRGWVLGLTAWDWWV